MDDGRQERTWSDKSKAKIRPAVIKYDTYLFYYHTPSLWSVFVPAGSNTLSYPAGDAVTPTCSMLLVRRPGRPGRSKFAGGQGYQSKTFVLICLVSSVMPALPVLRCDVLLRSVGSRLSLYPAAAGKGERVRRPTCPILVSWYCS